MIVELTEPAERDIGNILRDTLHMFGPAQVRAYGHMIDKAIALVAGDPDRPGSSDRNEIAAGVRVLPLEIAAGRRGAAAHCLYYTTGRLSDGTVGTIVLRVLHERMEPRYRVARALGARQHQSRPDP